VMGPKRGAAGSPKGGEPAKKAKAGPAKGKGARADALPTGHVDEGVTKTVEDVPLDASDGSDGSDRSDGSLAWWSEEEVELLTASAEEQAKNEMLLHVVDKRGPPTGKMDKGVPVAASTLADIGPAPRADDVLARGLGVGGLQEEVEAEEEAAMQWMISPVSVESFWHHVWQRRVLVVQRNAHNPGMYEGLLTSEECRALVTGQKDLEYGRHVQVLSCKDGVFEEQVSEPDASKDDIGMAKASTVWSKHEKGAVVRVLRPQRTVESLWRLLSRLEDATRCTLDCTAVLVPRGSAGLPPRCEESDVFILQLEGNAQWRVDGPNSIEEVLPMEGADFDPEDMDAEEGVFQLDVNLAPGDLLYLPRGFIHRCNTEKSTQKGSLHLMIAGFSAQGSTWGDLMTVALTQAVAAATARHPEMRMAVPPGVFRTLGALHDDVDSDSESDESDEENEEDGDGPPAGRVGEVGTKEQGGRTGAKGTGNDDDDDDEIPTDSDDAIEPFQKSAIITGTKRNEARAALADDLEERLDMILDELDFDGAADHMAASFQVHRLPPPGMSTRAVTSGRGEPSGKGKGKKAPAADNGKLDGSSAVVGVPSSYWTISIEGERLVVYHCLGADREKHAELQAPAMLDDEYLEYGEHKDMLDRAHVAFPLDVALLVEALLRSGADGEKPKTVEECGDDAAEAEDLQEDELMFEDTGSDSSSDEEDRPPGGGGDASDGSDDSDDDDFMPGVAAELVRNQALPVAQFLFDAGLLRRADAE